MKKSEPALGQVEIFPGYARVTLDIANGRTVKLVPIEVLANAFAGVRLGTGILPERALFYERQGDAHWLAVYVPPGITTLKAVRRKYTVPMPGFVFAGKGHSYQLFAVKSGWPGERTALYRAPLTNVGSGNICMGNAQPPACHPETIWEAWEVFREALFTGHHIKGQCKSYDDVMQLWAVLERDKVQKFPEDELIYAGMTLGSLAKEHR